MTGADNDQREDDLMAYIDRDDPVHRASFYVEDLKWGKGNWGNVDPAKNAEPSAMTRADAVEQVKALVETAGLKLDPDAVVDAVAYFASSWEEQTKMPLMVCLALFYDGFLLGMTVAAGLEGDVPEVYQPENRLNGSSGQ